MTPRFSPGPWRERIATGTCDHMIRSDGAHESVCVVPYKYGTTERRGANASLIMAAPDLYEALRTLLREDTGTDADSGWNTDAERLARTALAKAEGRAATDRSPTDSSVFGSSGCAGGSEES